MHRFRQKDLKPNVCAPVVAWSHRNPSQAKLNADSEESLVAKLRAAFAVSPANNNSLYAVAA